MNNIAIGNMKLLSASSEPLTLAIGAWSMSIELKLAKLLIVHTGDYFRTT
jgi:hypothetical protein